MNDTSNAFRDAEALLRIIDERIAHALNRGGYVKRELAIVVSVSGIKLQVRLLRDTAKNAQLMTVSNKTGETCAVGNVVYVEETNGIIVNATLKCGN